MVLLPVVERELRVASRGRTAYRVRFWSVVFMAGIFAWGMQSLSYFQNMSQQGGAILRYLTVCAYVFSLLIGVLVTADSISHEKRDGTLGLLFLTDLNGYDVVCGKLAAHSINALYALVATMPVLGIPLLMGGVTFAQFAKVALALVSTMVLSLCVGIFVSTFSRDERKAMVFTFFILAGMVCLPFFLALEYARFSKNVWMDLMFCPGYGIFQALGPASGPSISFWFSVDWEWMVSAVLVAIACVHVPNSWEEGSAKKKARVRPGASEAPSRSRNKRGRAWLEKNPFLWLALQSEEASRKRVWMFMATMVAIWLVAAWKFGMKMALDRNLMWFEMFIINTPLKIWIAAEACRLLSEHRSQNAFELLLSTPLRETTIIDGQWLALRKQFLWPLACVFSWEILVSLYNFRHDRWGGTVEMSSWPQILLMAADSYALASAGMWFGLKLKGRIRALLATVTLVLIIPVGIALTVIVGAGLNQDVWSDLWTVFSLFRAFMVDPIVIAVTNARLLEEFRQIAVQR